MVGHFGLKTIHAEEGKKNAFRMLLTLFAVNHLFHFYFVSHYFTDQHMDLAISHNIHGFITYMFVMFIPVVLWTRKKMTRVLYYTLILHLFNVTYFICITFYARYKPVDPAYLHRLGILVMIGALLNMLRKAYLQRTIPFPVPQELTRGRT